MKIFFPCFILFCLFLDFYCLKASSAEDKGDRLSVIYNKNTETGDNTASFIQVMTEEDLRLMQKDLKSGLNVIKEETIPSEEEIN